MKENNIQYLKLQIAFTSVQIDAYSSESIFPYIDAENYFVLVPG